MHTSKANRRIMCYYPCISFLKLFLLWKDHICKSMYKICLYCLKYNKNTFGVQYSRWTTTKYPRWRELYWYHGLIVPLHDILFLLFSSLVMSDSLWPHGFHQPRPLCPLPSPNVCPNSGSLHRWCHLALSSSDTFSFCPQSFQHHGLFQWVSCLHQVTKILEFQLQHQSFQWVFRVDFP